jgi:voltage-gated potassium channel
MKRTKKRSIKEVLHHILEKGSFNSIYYLWFDYFISALIVLNVVAIMLESVNSLKETYHIYFKTFEVVSVVIFSIEYLLRIYIADLTYKKSRNPRLTFIFSFYGMVDFLSIIPFYLPFFVVLDLRFLRILRLMRFLRIFKLNRYSNALQIISDVLRSKRSELITTGFLAIVVILIASFLIYYTEGVAQPDSFPNIFASIWWSIVTLTTVGYGDVYPITITGKFVGAIIAIMGIGLVALPTGIIGSGFVERMDKKKKKTHCPHCGKEIDEE